MTKSTADASTSSFTIGAFIVGAIALSFAALIFFSGGQLFTKKERVVMYFLGSVQGLQIGAPIKLKGVVLGEVTDIQLDFQSDRKIITAPETIITAVTAELVMQRINQKSLNENDFFDSAIANGLRAQLNFQSLLTGLLYVELDFHRDVPVTLYGLQSRYRELPTMPMSFEELAKSLQEMNLKGFVSNLDHLTVEISKVVDSGVIQQALSDVGRAAISIENTSSNINTKVNLLSKNLDNTRVEMDKLIGQLNQQTPQVADSLKQSMADFRSSMQQFNNASNTINGVFSEDAELVYQLNKTLEDISRSARAFHNLSEVLEQQPESILRGKNTANPMQKED
ncbi:MAG TPA: MlaD family protein [Cellvibrio sp.]|nr:MlaD family protein [Cellvibrio sp.]